MKISETIADINEDLQKVDDKEIVSITFTGITWKLQISSLKKNNRVCQQVL